MAEPLLVVDISHHQGRDVSTRDGLPSKHWHALAECGVKAAIIKVSQGTGHVDEDAAIHVQRARAGSPCVTPSRSRSGRVVDGWWSGLRHVLPRGS